MIKLTKEQFASLNLKTGVRGRISRNQSIKDALRGLGVEESVLIERSDWTGKTAPAANINSWFKDIKFATRTLVDNSAWAVTRIK